MTKIQILVESLARNEQERASGGRRSRAGAGVVAAICLSLAPGRLSLDKKLHGDLEATGKGEMLTAVTDVKGSAGYVAIERVTGTLHGRSGSFVPLHRGIMTNRGQDVTLTVVPDSGTRELAGLAGEMAIQIADGKHSYDLAYTVPKPR